MVTVKAWKDIISFDPIKDGHFDIDGTVARIAAVKGKTVEEIEKDTAIEDLLPTFLDCVHECNNMVFKRLDMIPKNGSGASQE
jgi:hypothetical protein